MPYKSRKRRGGSGGSGGDGSGTGGPGGGGYTPGQNLQCKITDREPGGYTVIVGREHLPGYLLSDKNYDIGQVLIAQFSCVDSYRMRMEEIDVYEQHFGIGGPGIPSDESANAQIEPGRVRAGLELLDSSPGSESGATPFLHVVESSSDAAGDEDEDGEGDSSNVIDLFRDK